MWFNIYCAAGPARVQVGTESEGEKKKKRGGVGESEWYE